MGCLIKKRECGVQDLKYNASKGVTETHGISMEKLLRERGEISSKALKMMLEFGMGMRMPFLVCW